MPLPRWVARFNKRFTNRLLEPVARRFSNFAVVHHVGRVSGVGYTTPVNSFGYGERLIVALTYGPNADWARNVLHGPTQIETRGQMIEVISARLVGRPEAWPELPRLVRLVLRALRVRHFLELSVATDSSQ